MAQPISTSVVREAKLFRNNRSQAVRIPAEFEFSGSRVLIHKEGDKLIIEPEPRANLVDILKALAPLGPEDDFPEDIDATLLPLKDVDL
ncbi:antitoxin [Sphingobium sp.]|uniref:antitoxin n=1 Tax=Sphingobium sp. TaxID=1912891 RepID=UPI003BB62D5D